ncbi:MAG: hypothetical protein V4631_10760 [Pseudomonadota bacterium]
MVDLLLDAQRVGAGLRRAHQLRKALIDVSPKRCLIHTAAL